MRKLVGLAAIFLVGLWTLSQAQPAASPAPEHPAAPVVASAPAQSDRGPVADSTPTAPASPATVAAPPTDLEEGVEGGGFDPRHPPAGAPAAASLQVAFAQATGYVRSINSYGHGDQSLNDFIIRSRPFMTASFFEEWNDIAQMAAEVSADSQLWASYQTTRTRHEAQTSEPIVTAWTADRLTLTVPYRAADIPTGGTVPASATERYARVDLVRAETTWLVQRATTDS